MQTRMALHHFAGVLLNAAAFGAAPAAAAQELVARVGSSIPYQVSLPVGAQIEDDGETLVGWTEGAMVLVGVRDLMESHKEHEPAISEAEARRNLTARIMGSDSILLDVADQVLGPRKMELREMVTEFRTLGGERAVYIRGRFSHVGATGWIEVHTTFKDAIAYTLMVTTTGDDRAAFDALAPRVHASFRLPDGPPRSLSSRKPPN